MRAERRAVAQLKSDPRDWLHAAAESQPRRGAEPDDEQLHPGECGGEDDGGDDRGNRRTLRVGAQLTCHTEHAMGNDRQRHELKPMNGGLSDRPGHLREEGSEAEQQSADGRVKLRKAASAPGQPARTKPRLNPSLLLAGPGRNWQRARS